MVQATLIGRFLLEIIPDGTIILSTARAADVIGYSFGELKSRSIFDLVPADMVSDFQKELFEVMENRMPFEGLETTMLAKNGEPIDVSISGIFIRAHGVPLYQLTVRDIREAVRVKKEFKKTREEADLYLDLIAHDIANLNQIGMGYLELALDTLPLDDTGRALLQKPLDVFKSTNRLIGNVKKLRASHRDGELNIERISLAEVLKSLANEFPPVPGREITLNYHPDQDCAVMANGLIREIFVNLIGNSIKHSPADKPLTVDVSLGCVRENDVARCRIVVEDDGPGMPDSLKHNLMMSMDGRGGVRGRGVGLMLISTLVEDFDGSIIIEDRVPGDYRQGTRVIVLLPTAPASDDIDGHR